MTNPLDQKIANNVDIKDFVLGSLAKPFIEKAMAPVVGNGTLVSGIAKGAIALGAAKYGKGSTISKVIAIGAGLDAAEDGIVYATTKMGMKTTQAQSSGAIKF